jgi:hypothetical protein
VVVDGSRLMRQLMGLYSTPVENISTLYLGQRGIGCSPYMRGSELWWWMVAVDAAVGCWQLVG